MRRRLFNRPIRTVSWATRLVIPLVCLLAQAHPAAQSTSAALVFPANGAVGADFAKPIQWNTVSGAQAYYLYVGTTVGTNNLINTGETQQTSYSAAGLPANQTVYARLWTKADGTWRFTDSSFSGDVLTTKIVSPANGATSADWTLPIQWTPVLNIQTYYLYVGTSVGAKDLIDSGETPQTSFSAMTLPANRVVYARLWTKVAGVWRYTDSSFSGDVLTTKIVSPVNGATSADWTLPIQWTPVRNIQTYYLYVGTSVGAKDLIDSGETLQTSFSAMTLPANRVVYARLWTKVAGAWRYTDSSFSGDVLTARITSPTNGATNADWTSPIEWTVVPNAQAYYLYAGTTVGTNNLINSRETTRNSFAATALPSDALVYARLWTKVGGIWRYVDSSFRGAPLTSMLTYPANGATSADLIQPIRWTTIPGAQAYYLFVGSTLGAKDFVNTGETQSTSVSAFNVPPGRVVYARLWTKVANVWRSSDSTFTARPLKAVLTAPADAATAAAAQPFRWMAVANADAYYLYVGSSVGAKDLVNTGEIQTTSFVASSLPAGQKLYARIWTKIAGFWLYSDSTFAMAPTGPLVQSSDLQYEGAFRVPDGDFGSPQYHGFHYGGGALTFNGLRDSLFVVGHAQDQLVAEVSIPAVRTGALSSLDTAAVLQNFFDPLEGKRNDINPTDPNTKLIGGLMLLADRMLVSAYSYYDGLGTQVLSHFSRPLTLALSGAVTGPFQVGTLAGMVSGYMAPVPADWHIALGGSVLTGNCCLGVISRTSFGPAVSAIDPANVGLTNPVPAARLVGYPSTHQTLGTWNGSNPLFNGTTQIQGVIFPTGTRSVLFFGRRGLGTFCYGPGTANSILAGQLADGGIDRYCLDPADGSKGTHAYPYAYTVWAYDALDLAAVRAGAKQEWEVVPYSVWNLALPYSTGGGLLLGATFDAATGRIFLSQAFGDGEMPVIHVFHVF